VHFYKGGKIEIRKFLNGNKIALFKGKTVEMTILSEVEVPVLSEKELVVWKDKKKYIPPINHPLKHRYVIQKRYEEMLANAV